MGDYPASDEEFVAALDRLGIKLPLRLSEEDVGVVLDAEGRDVFTVDVNNGLSDAEATEIAELLVAGVHIGAGL
jgi:hypothetical protein